jgi:antirestriction protein ArdC
MSRKVTTRKSPEQRRAEAKALQESIGGQVEALKDSDQWTKFLEFVQNFHAYSVNNVLLIFSQRPDATQVAGFRKWQELGRQVRKGEKAIKIFGYAQKKIQRTDANNADQEDTDDDVDTATRTYFPMLSVFSLEQTEPGDDREDHSTPARQVAGDDPAGIYQATTEWLADRGWTIEHRTLPGHMNGSTDFHARRVEIDPSLPPAHAARTALHEAAHVLLHEPTEDEVCDPASIRETEAESVAYVLAGILGIDASTYSIAYVASWTAGQDADTIKQTAGRVLSAVDQLAQAITTETGQPATTAA